MVLVCEGELQASCLKLVAHNRNGSFDQQIQWDRSILRVFVTANLGK